jgi:DNA-binding transcriptional MerR regulator
MSQKARLWTMVQSQVVSGSELLKIGEVAGLAGVSVDTVRFYERRGLLRAPERTASGYRKYPRSAIERIVLTRQLRQLGMTLEEIAAAMGAAEHGTECSTELWRLELVRDRIDAKLAELTSTRRELDRVIESCHGCSCRIQTPDD